MAPAKSKGLVGFDRWQGREKNENEKEKEKERERETCFFGEEDGDDKERDRSGERRFSYEPAGAGQEMTEHGRTDGTGRGKRPFTKPCNPLFLFILPCEGVTVPGGLLKQEEEEEEEGGELCIGKRNWRSFFFSPQAVPDHRRNSGWMDARMDAWTGGRPEGRDDEFFLEEEMRGQGKGNGRGGRHCFSFSSSFIADTIDDHSKDFPP